MVALHSLVKLSQMFFVCLFGFFKLFTVLFTGISSVGLAAAYYSSGKLI